MVTDKHAEDLDALVEAGLKAAEEQGVGIAPDVCRGLLVTFLDARDAEGSPYLFLAADLAEVPVHTAEADQDQSS